MFENTLTGLPICRPLFINNPDDKALYNDKARFLGNQFFVGSDLLVAPVLEPQLQGSYDNLGKRDVYLPAGDNWYCFVNNVMPLGPMVEGGTTVLDFDANLNLSGSHIHFIVPMYVRAGAIIPTIELEQYVGQRNQEGRPNPITLNIYPGASGEYTLYLDDGESRSSADPDAHPLEFGGDPQAKGEYRKTKVTHSCPDGGTTRKITVERIHDGYTPKLETYFFIALLHDPFEAKGSSGCLKGVTIDGKQINCIAYGTPEQRSAGLEASPVNAWYYHAGINISFIKVFDVSQKIVVTAEHC